MMLPMARWVPLSSPLAKPQFFFILTLLSSFATIQLQVIMAENNQGYARSLDPELYLGVKKQKLSHFRVYWHDIFSGPKPTAGFIVRPISNASKTLFGAVCMIDDPLTVGPELSSKLVGRAQGLFGSSGHEKVSLIMAMNFVFLEGKYNGSTITILGRNEIFSKVREMPVVGGSGLFRFARGYAEVRTYSFDQKKGNAVVEYNLYVLHY